MSKILSKKKQDELTFTLDYLVENPEYQEWKEKLIDQILKNVEVEGFRKGKAPRDKAIEKIGEQNLVSNIFQETLQKYAGEAIEEVKKEVKKMKRAITNFQVDSNPELTKESEQGFQFRIAASLLPEIDLKALDSIKVKVDEKDIEGRPEFQKFAEDEKAKIVEKYNQYDDSKEGAKDGDVLVLSMEGKVDGKKDERLKAEEFTLILGNGQFLPDFEKGVKGAKKGEKKEFPVKFPKDYFEKTLAGKTAEFTVKVKEVKRPKYKNLADIIKNSEVLKNQFQDEKALEDYLQNFYNQQTQTILQEKVQRDAIKQLVEKVPDFPLSESAIKSETERIANVVKDKAEEGDLKIGEAFVQTGLPGSEDSKAKNFDEKEVKKAIENYVRKEFKLTAILNYIYETVASENKVSDEDIERITKEAKEDREKYNIDKDATDDQIRNIINDRLVRQVAMNYILKKVNDNSAPKADTKNKAKKK